MLTIRREQFALLVAGWEQSRRAAVIDRLRREFPGKTGLIPPQQMEKQVADGFDAAEALGIRDTDHIYRVLALRYSPAFTWERPGAQELLMRVLTDTSLDAESRLRFVEMAIVGIGAQEDCW